MKLEKKAIEKQIEIIDFIKEIIQNYAIQNNEIIDELKVEKMSSEIFNYFISIIPTEIDISYKSLTIQSGGINGGRSIKPGNIWLNWKKLMIDGSESILAIIGTASLPWLIPFACLVIWSKIYSVMSIQITERHSVVIWAMWFNRNQQYFIKKNKVMDLVNNELSKYNRPKMNQDELESILRDLVKMECITEDKNNWILKESVKVELE